MKIEQINHWLTKVFIVALVLLQGALFVSTRAAFTNVNQLQIQFILSSDSFTIGEQVLIQANISNDYDFNTVHFIIRDSDNLVDLEFQAILENDNIWVADSLWDTIYLMSGIYYLSASASAYDSQGNMIEFATSNDYEIVLEDKDKTLLTCLINAKIIEDVDSNKVRIIGSLKNVTEQRESEIERKEYELRYRKLFESSSDAVILQDENGLIDCNNAATKLLGYSSKDELIKLKPADVSPMMQANNKPSKETSEEYYNQTIKNGNMKFEWELIKQNGRSFNAEVWLSSFQLNCKTFIQATIREIPDNKK